MPLLIPRSAALAALVLIGVACSGEEVIRPVDATGGGGGHVASTDGSGGSREAPSATGTGGADASSTTTSTGGGTSCVEPEVVVPDAVMVSELVADEGGVYWIAGSSALYGRTLDGQPSLAAMIPEGSSHLAETASKLVWMVPSSAGAPANGAILACDVTGCPQGFEVVVPGIRPDALAADGDRLVWSGRDGNGVGGIWTCALPACAPSLVWQSSGGSIFDIAVRARSGPDATKYRIAWRSGADIVSCALEACVPSLVAAAPQSPGGFAIDGDFAYWGDWATDSLRSCPLSGCATGGEELTPTGQPGSVVAHGGALFWTAGLMGAPPEIRRCADTSCSSGATLLASAPCFAYAVDLSVTDHFVYYADASRILRVPY
ncbi:MAG TPA: hypothetical protein VL400_19160 [Polyangiaceae bacterium]|nr:hypothetical protein [Polyangiaceae bacterium]